MKMMRLSLSHCLISTVANSVTPQWIATCWIPRANCISVVTTLTVLALKLKQDSMLLKAMRVPLWIAINAAVRCSSKTVVLANTLAVPMMIVKTPESF